MPWDVFYLILKTFPRQSTQKFRGALQVEAKYMQLAKDMLAYERDTTQHWMQHAHASAESLMRQPVLIEDPQTHRFFNATDYHAVCALVCFLTRPT